ncbi:MAG: hypothetical protein JWN87_3071 [Frankiales bacterium]|nr:hypothetical protein [Frankiales bacterium]
MWSTGQVRASGFLATVEQVRPGTATLPVAVVALLATTSCSRSGAQPASLPRVSATQVPTALVAAVPDSAKPATPLGAAAFVRYWFQLLDEAYRTGRIFPVDELSDPRCVSCRNFSGVADDLARDGYHFAGPSFTSIDVQAPPVENGMSYVALFCKLPARQKVDRTGHVVASYPQEKQLVMTVMTQRHGTSWVIRAMRTES